MFRRLLDFRLLVLLTAVSILPGWPELLENLEHLLHDGHLAHSAQHDEAAEGTHAEIDEHGCTPMQHLCACHVSMQALLSEPGVPAPPVGQLFDENHSSLKHGDPTSLAIPPPKRPPIA